MMEKFKGVPAPFVFPLSRQVPYFKNIKYSMHLIEEVPHYVDNLIALYKEGAALNITPPKYWFPTEQEYEHEMQRFILKLNYFNYELKDTCELSHQLFAIMQTEFEQLVKQLILPSYRKLKDFL